MHGNEQPYDMNLLQVIELQRKQRNREITSLPFKITKRRMAKGYLSINGYVVIPIENCATLLDRNSDIPIRDGSTEIGYLCFTKGIVVENLSTLTELHFSCYLNEIPTESELETAYEFNADYVIVYYPYIKNYIDNYLLSAPLWGYFNHAYTGLSINPPVTKTFPYLSVSASPKFSENYYHEASVRGIKQSLAFERFLKYYHLLELNFDYDVIKRIKELNTITHSKDIGSILNEYRREDLDRLRYLFMSYCTDIDSIVLRLNEIKNHLPIADDIFYEFGKKEGNPLKEKNKMHVVANSIDGFTLSRCKTAKIQQVNDILTHAQFIGNLTTYWIYRIRCSIAHNKVGEYLMSHNDEKFVVEFGEPLLLDFLRQVFK